MSERELLDELRAGRFDAMASSELRARVRELAAQAPERRPARRRHFSWRRSLLVLAPACLAAVAAAAMLHGLVSSGGGERDRVARTGEAVTAATFARKPAPSPAAWERASVGKTRDARTLSSATLPAGRRLADYRVRMRLRLSDTDGLSDATVQAMRVARRLGGYVVSVRYSTPGARSGDAVLVLRVPTAQMQTALVRLSSLGTIVSQAVSLVDLQKAFNKEAARIGKLGTQVGRLRARLEDESLPAEERAKVEEQLEYLKLELGAVSRQHKATRERGRLGTISLSLFSRQKQAQPAVPATPSRFDRALGDAGGILGKELTWGLYAAIVAAPLALLLLLALFSEKGRRRRSEHRLLARA